MSLIARLYDGAGTGSYVDLTTSTLSISNLATVGMANKISSIVWSTDPAITGNYLIVAYKNTGLAGGNTAATSYTFVSDMDTSAMSTYGFDNNINSIEAINVANIYQNSAILYDTSLGFYGNGGGGGKQQFVKAVDNCTNMDSCATSPYFGNIGQDTLSYAKLYPGTRVDIYTNTNYGGTQYTIGVNTGGQTTGFNNTLYLGPFAPPHVWFADNQASSFKVSVL
jgi:hypothetical protein